MIHIKPCMTHLYAFRNTASVYTFGLRSSENSKIQNAGCSRIKRISFRAIPMAHNTKQSENLSQLGTLRNVSAGTMFAFALLMFTCTMHKQTQSRNSAKTKTALQPTHTTRIARSQIMLRKDKKLCAKYCQRIVDYIVLDARTHGVYVCVSVCVRLCTLLSFSETVIYGSNSFRAQKTRNAHMEQRHTHSQISTCAVHYYPCRFSCLFFGALNHDAAYVRLVCTTYLFVECIFFRKYSTRTGFVFQTVSIIPP